MNPSLHNPRNSAQRSLGALALALALATPLLFAESADSLRSLMAARSRSAASWTWSESSRRTLALDGRAPNIFEEAFAVDLERRGDLITISSATVVLPGQLARGGPWTLRQLDSGALSQADLAKDDSLKDQDGKPLDAWNLERLRDWVQGQWRGGSPRALPASLLPDQVLEAGASWTISQADWTAAGGEAVTDFRGEGKLLSRSPTRFEIRLSYAATLPPPETLAPGSRVEIFMSGEVDDTRPGMPCNLSIERRLRARLTVDGLAGRKLEGELDWLQIRRFSRRELER